MPKLAIIAQWIKSQCTSVTVTPTSISESNGADIIEERFSNEDLYTGTLANNTRHGSGKYLWRDGCMYEGEWKKGEASGRGKLSWPSGATFEGQFKSGWMEGMGIFRGANGCTYIGDYSLDKKHGYGIMHYSNGDFYKGQWGRNLQDGQGRYLCRNGNEYIGEWKNGAFHGRGVAVWNNGYRYDGDWENGVPTGNGVVTWPDGSCYIYCWLNDPDRSRRTSIFKEIFYPAHNAENDNGDDDEAMKRYFMRVLPITLNGTEVEVGIMCQTSGFSEIGCFVISLEVYEAMKVRSTSASVLFSQKFDPVSYQENEGYCNDAFECPSDIGGRGVVDAINRPTEGNDVRIISPHSSAVSELSKRLRDFLKMSNVVCGDNITSRSSEYRGNGSKGLTSPLLRGPTRDPSGGFHLENVSGFEGRSCLDENEDDMKGKAVMNEMNSVMSECCLLKKYSNDDGSSSSTMRIPSISTNGKFRPVIKGWRKGDPLGHGTFGSVYEGIADDGFFFAVKEVSLLDKGDDGKQCIIQLEQEIALLSQFEHENIVQYYGTKKDESHLYIFLELVTKGSLLSLYQKYELRAPQVSAYTRQILNGLKYLHDRNVVHRDIKCANILVHTNALVKLADFGLAKATKLNDVKSCKGTALWMAPEVVRSRGYGLPADIWSLGCTVLEMLTRRFPYSNLEEVAAVYRIGKGERPPIPDSLPNDARDFILECLQVDPSLRPTANQLLDHPFVK